MMRKIKHGTQGAYNNGCTCRKCKDAAASAAWAHRQVENWSAPLEVHVIDDVNIDVNIEVHMISAEMISRAISKSERKIKISALRLLWADLKDKGLLHAGGWNRKATEGLS